MLALASKVNWIETINFLLSAAIMTMTAVHAVWGLILPYTKKKDDKTLSTLEDYISNLELYANVVGYTDSVLIPLKIIFSILAKKFCACCIEEEEVDTDGFDDDNPRPPPVDYHYVAEKVFQEGDIKTYQFGKGSKV